MNRERGKLSCGINYRAVKFGNGKSGACPMTKYKVTSSNNQAPTPQRP